jgi:ribosome-binding ATPase
MRIGILGLPQSGKRTLFTLLTGRKVPETRRPEDSLEGVASIRDPRVDVLSGICKPESTVYAENHFVLCPDVVEGTGTREWLEAARRCDLLCMVVRAFESDLVYHPAGSIDAARDRANLAAELLLADMMLVERRLERLAKEAKAGATRDQKVQTEALELCLATLEAEKPLTATELDDEQRASLGMLNFLTLKPVLWAYNTAEDDLAADRGPGAFSISARIEAEIAEIDDPKDRREFLESLGLEAPGLDRMNAAAYDALGLMSFYTIGEDEVRAWTIRKGSTAPAAGGKVHSDIERGFIRVEIIKYDDLVAAGSEKAAKDRGKVAVKGRDYVIQDGDICHFLFNV